MTFRTAYLRAIGVIWNRPSSALAADLLSSSNNALDVMAANFGTKIPWNARVQLIQNPIPAKRPQWRPRLSGGWVGGEDHHKIIIYVPSHECLALPSPPGASIASEQEALAAYYDISPTLFGTSEPTAVPGGGGAQTFDIKLGTIEPFEEFGGVFMRMLALLWKVPAELSLASVPNDLFGPTPDVVFQRWLGYRWPWNMVMEFIKCTPNLQPLPGGGFVKHAMRWVSSSDVQTGRWEFATVNPATGVLGAFGPGLPPNEITLSIPDNPMTETDPSVRDVAIEPLALAAYNQTGECYPLTCCGC
jgi:hypothetical protein